MNTATASSITIYDLSTRLPPHITWGLLVLACILATTGFMFVYGRTLSLRSRVWG